MFLENLNEIIINTNVIHVAKFMLEKNKNKREIMKYNIKVVRPIENKIIVAGELYKKLNGIFVNLKVAKNFVDGNVVINVNNDDCAMIQKITGTYVLNVWEWDQEAFDKEMMKLKELKEEVSAEWLEAKSWYDNLSDVERKYVELLIHSSIPTAVA